MNTLLVTVLSPEKKVAEAECSEAIIPTEEGTLTILPNHAPLAGLLKPGVMELRVKSGPAIHLAVTGGFLTVANNTLRLLTDFVARHDEIDEKVILAAKQQAEKLLTEHKSDEELARARTDLLRASLQLQLLERRKHHHTSPTP